MDIELPSDLPAPPKLKLDRDLAAVNSVRQVFSTARGRLSEVTALRWAQQIERDWFKRPVPRAHLEDTLRTFVGQDIEMNELLWAHQLVGRHSELLVGPISPFQQITHPHWEVLEVRAVQRVFRDGKDLARMHLFSLSGQAAGMLFDQNTTSGFVRYLAYSIGFSRQLEFDDHKPWLLTGFRFWGYVAPPEDPENPQLSIAHFFPNAQQKKQNVQKAKLRLRHYLDADVECPYELTLSCDECSKGTAECQAALRISARSELSSASSVNLTTAG